MPRRTAERPPGQPRPLTERETAVLLAMIEHASEAKPGLASAATSGVTPAQRERWRAAVGGLVVTDTCGCGTCPTITLTPEDEASGASAAGTGMPGVDGGGGGSPLMASSEGGILLLFADERTPRMLEFAPVQGGVFDEFPPPAQIVF
ncbi:hypothetical protein BRM1_02765 [Brevibacterium sp. BRM-1]|uniref:hypothetical protein n=1 Tax=Brevibacterium sp. BRM-1 TaxID=2999062 RepID=UPI002282629F|nr:hypothetical protein [Brevibacterium sp. BRM-1]WAL40810.1 hypothetical protein BRM1_02765 [Brevibacterium sp. BRM-1]